MPLVASNRTGTEDVLTFYGSAFIADPSGALVQQANKTDDNVVLVHEFDLEKVTSACRISLISPFALAIWAVKNSFFNISRLFLQII